MGSPQHCRKMSRSRVQRGRTKPVEAAPGTWHDECSSSLMISEQSSSLSAHGRLLHSKKLSVVVADDDTDARELLASALAADGYVVVEARDGYELLGLLAASVTRAPGHLRFDAI